LYHLDEQGDGVLQTLPARRVQRARRLVAEEDQPLDETAPLPVQVVVTCPLLLGRRGRAADVAILARCPVAVDVDRAVGSDEFQPLFCLLRGEILYRTVGVPPGRSVLAPRKAWERRKAM
jgi:hypothetical protein